MTGGTFTHVPPSGYAPDLEYARLRQYYSCNIYALNAIEMRCIIYTAIYKLLILFYFILFL